MGTFLLIAMLVSIGFHFVLFRMMGKICRTLLYNYRILAALIVLGTDFFMLIFVGAGNIVGIANLGGGLCLALWIFVVGYFCKDRVRMVRHGLIPKLVLVRSL